MTKAAAGETFPYGGAWGSNKGWYANKLTCHQWKGTDYGAGFLKADSASEIADKQF